MSEHGAATIVVHCDNDSVLVSLPMRGFPVGFRLRTGEKVMAMVEGSDLVAKPLVEMAVVNESCEDLATRHLAAVSGRPCLLQSATALDKSAQPNQGALVFTIDPGTAGEPRQVVAIRPR